MSGEGRDEQERSLELQQTTVVNTQYAVIQTSASQETTELNGWYCTVQTELQTMGPSAEYSLVQKEPSQTTDTYGEYSVVQIEPQCTTQTNTQLYSVVQKKPKQTKTNQRATCSARTDHSIVFCCPKEAKTNRRDSCPNRLPTEHRTKRSVLSGAKGA